MKNNINRASNAGFTLIEVMITVVIIGILSAVALPSYLEQVRKSKRAEAMGAALECAGILERNFTIRNNYDGMICDSLSATLENYSVAVDTTEGTNGARCVFSGRANCFTITVSPLAAGSQSSDADCTGFMLNHRGVKTATGANSGECWRD